MTYKDTIIQILNSIEVPYSENRVCLTYSYDFINTNALPHNCSRSATSQLLQKGFELQGVLQEVEYEKAKALSSVCYLFDYIKSHYKYSQLLGFVDKASSLLDLKDLNGGEDFNFDDPKPAFLKELTRFVSSGGYDGHNWDFSLMPRNGDVPLSNHFANY
ncbi:hypothetical protein [Vibrio sp. D431a]|uniref:hypothetical protein n=1 Tax=Vibrio sp. D431a TaxID=2837388 RepID=UPI0025569BE4|nr:hypothetical protein [Vibrio sp. D431a]MDK9793337.1 hypothetical protein [Vibrio sp. D431a]